MRTRRGGPSRTTNEAIAIRARRLEGIEQGEYRLLLLLHRDERKAHGDAEQHDGRQDTLLAERLRRGWSGM